MIQPIGRYLPQNKNGILLNDTAWEKISSHWQVLINEVKEIYLQQAIENLHSIYLRGSVAAGFGVDGVSDLDTFAVIKSVDVQWKEFSWAEELKQKSQKKFPFVSDVELYQTGISPDGQLINPNIIPILKIQSLCLWGEDLIPALPDYTPGRNLARNYRWLEDDLIVLRKAHLYSNEKIRTSLKSILRSGFELVMEREGRFTTDLYPCYKSFARYYPEWEEEMRQVLEYYLEIPDQKKELSKISDRLGNQLLDWFANW